LAVNAARLLTMILSSITTSQLFKKSVCGQCRGKFAVNLQVK
jgi:hypothetical protein